MNYREQTNEILNNQPNITRKQYIAEMVGRGLSANAASLYYHKFINIPRKVRVIEALKANGPQRDSKGRFIKKAA